MNQSLSQLISQSTSQSIIQAINLPSKQSIAQSIDGLIWLSLSRRLGWLNLPIADFSSGRVQCLGTGVSAEYGIAIVVYTMLGEWNLLLYQVPVNLLPTNITRAEGNSLKQRRRGEGVKWLPLLTFLGGGIAHLGLNPVHGECELLAIILAQNKNDSRLILTRLWC